MSEYSVQLNTNLTLNMDSCEDCDVPCSHFKECEDCGYAPCSHCKECRCDHTECRCLWEHSCKCDCPAQQCMGCGFGKSDCECAYWQV